MKKWSTADYPLKRDKLENRSEDTPIMYHYYSNGMQTLYLNKVQKGYYIYSSLDIKLESSTINKHKTFDGGFIYEVKNYYLGVNLFNYFLTKYIALLVYSEHDLCKKTTDKE